MKISTIQSFFTPMKNFTVTAKTIMDDAKIIIIIIAINTMTKSIGMIPFEITSAISKIMVPLNQKVEIDNIKKKSVFIKFSY